MSTNLDAELARGYAFGCGKMAYRQSGDCGHTVPERRVDKCTAFPGYTSYP